MTRRPEEKLLFPIQLAGRVALAVSAAALLILATTLLFISDGVGQSYLQVLQSYQYTQSALHPGLILAGLALARAHRPDHLAGQSVWQLPHRRHALPLPAQS